jgi:pimeloyl-ACP methyl ester carboxylesterase
VDRTVIVSVHGIRTKIEDVTSWPGEFDKWLRTNYTHEMNCGDLVHLPFSYGFIGAVGSDIINVLTWMGLGKFANSFAVAKFAKFMRQVIDSYPGYKVNIVAHSFGTWVVHQALETHPDLHINQYHLFGAVISAHISKNWIDEMLMTKQINQVMVWPSHSDMVVRYIAVPPFGHLGFWGLLTEDPQDRNVPKWKPFTYLEAYNRLLTCGHSGYFTPERFQILMRDLNEEIKE